MLSGSNWPPKALWSAEGRPVTPRVVHRMARERVRHGDFMSVESRCPACRHIRYFRLAKYRQAWWYPLWRLHMEVIRLRVVSALMFVPRCEQCEFDRKVRLWGC